MRYWVNLQLVEENVYDIVIQCYPGRLPFLAHEEEFSLEFLGKRLSFRMVRFVIGGVLALTIPASVIADSNHRYSMTYLSYGSYDKQMEYVALSNGSFSVISPSYFNILSDGTLSIEPVSKSYVEAMHQKGIKVVPFLSNHWDKTGGTLALENAEQIAAQIADAVEQYGLDGVNVDIENLSHHYRQQYTKLVRLLRQKIPQEKEVSVAVAANPNGWSLGWHGSYDYQALGEIADHLFLMAYDEHFQGGEAGPVASIGFVEKSIQYALQFVDGEKLVLGIPFFGRIWSEDGSLNGVGMTHRQIASALQKTGGETRIDEASKSVVSQFQVTKTHTVSVNQQTLKPGNYTVWYDNSDTLKYKLSLVDKYGLKGAGSWSVGQETPDVWDYYSRWLNGKYFSDTFYHFAKDDILAVHEKGWMVGTSKHRFHPEDGMTRAQAAVILCRYLNLHGDGGNLHFPDIAGHWAEKEMKQAANYGLMNGYPDGTFRPNEAITREELAVILQRILQYEYQDTRSSFSDLSAERWSYDEIKALLDGGILSGYPDGTFRPEQFLSRGEMAHLLKKTFLHE